MNIIILTVILCIVILLCMAVIALTLCLVSMREQRELSLSPWEDAEYEKVGQKRV